jgi:hypothetical protein
VFPLPFGFRSGHLSERLKAAQTNATDRFDVGIWFAEYYDPAGTLVGPTAMFEYFAGTFFGAGSKSENLYPTIAGLSDTGIVTVNVVGGMIPFLVETFQLPN